MGEMITLVCPEGAAGAPIAHGTQTFYSYRLDHTAPNWRDAGGPCAIDVPIELYHHFIGRAGFYVYEGNK